MSSLENRIAEGFYSKRNKLAKVDIKNLLDLREREAYDKKLMMTMIIMRSSRRRMNGWAIFVQFVIITHTFISGWYDPSSSWSLLLQWKKNPPLVCVTMNMMLIFFPSSPFHCIQCLARCCIIFDRLLIFKGEKSHRELLFFLRTWFHTFQVEWAWACAAAAIDYDEHVRSTTYMW